MFTGIVSAVGRLKESQQLEGDVRLAVTCEVLSLESAAPGDSISVSGACLTMLDPDAGGFQADVSRETLDVTTLGALQPGDPVNLELAMQSGDRFGGHMVTGHVDGRARLISRVSDSRAERFRFEAPPELARYIARKGSVCLDGVSLTINGVDGHNFDVCLIPHTLEVTTLGGLQAGDEVNIEVDLVARYLERLVAGEDT